MMKNIAALLLTVLVSAPALAHSCKVAIKDTRGTVFAILSTENDPQCGKAVNDCMSTLSYYRYDTRTHGCYVISKTPEDSPRPTTRPEQPRPAPQRPIPTPTPTPAPTPATDSRRDVEVGETVIFQSKYWVVTGSPQTGFFDLKPVNKKEKDVLRDVARHYVVITRGCHMSICTKSSVIDMQTRSYLAVEGIDYNGKFVLKNPQSGQLSFDVDASTLARTSGCSNAAGICVGNTVIARDNRYFRVAAIQPNGLLVLESQDNNRSLSFDVDSRYLTVTR